MAGTEYLDCTLRDGGYYTNWDFEPSVVEAYVASLEKLPVDIIEIGYRSGPAEGYAGQYRYVSPSTLRALRALAPSKRFALMLDEQGTSPESVKDILGPVAGLAELVRITVKPERFDTALTLANAIRAEGFAVGFNLMYLSKLVDDASILDRFSELNGVVDYAYLVDSYGGASPEDVGRFVRMAKERTSVKVGFHGHNNLELAFANSLAALAAGCDIVDGTVLGMGRGAGNLKTELFLTWLSSKQAVDFDALADAVSAFEPLHERHRWGTTLPYMVSGIASLPQKDVMDLSLKRTYSMSGIIRGLNERYGKGEALALSPFAPATFSRVLLISGGPSSVTHVDAIKAWIRTHLEGLLVVQVSSKNAKYYEDVEVPQVFCMVGNEGRRLESVFGDVSGFRHSLVIPPPEYSLGTYIPVALKGQAFRLPTIDIADKFKDSHTAIALQIAAQVGATEVYAAGYDGYQGESIHPKDHDLFKENEYLFEQFARSRDRVRSLTPTRYASVVADSLYRDLSDV